MDIEKRTTEITEKLYLAYGTDTGILFGISPSFKTPISWIVKFVLEESEKKE